MATRSEIIDYRQAIEHMDEPVRIHDPEANIVYANPKYCELTGYQPRDILGKSEYEFWDKKTRAKVYAVNHNERKRGLSSSYEGILLTKSGEEIPVLVSGSALPDGGTVGIFTDLRQVKKREEIERILSHALQHTYEIIIVFDKYGRIHLWNQGAKIAFGYRHADMQGASLETIFPSKDVNNLLQHSKVVHNFELTGTHKNGTAITVSATLTPLVQERSSEKFSYLLIARDITHHQKFEEEMALKYQKLKEAYNQFGIVRRRMDYMFELLDFAKANQDLKAVSNFVVASTIMLTKADGCILRRYNSRKKNLELLACFGVNDDWWGGAAMRYRHSLTEKAVSHRRPLKIIDLSQEPAYQNLALAKKHNFSSLLLIPLFFRNEFIGDLSLYTTPAKKLEIFENEFIEQYAKLVELTLGNLLS